MKAKYINPFTDFGFKKIFGEEASKPQLLDFLNAILPENDRIVSLSFKNKAIIEAKELGRTIHLFHQHENNGEHEYLGEVELVGKPEIQIHGDIDGKNREEFVFLLKPVQITDG